METASSNGHGTVAQVDAVTVEEADAGKVLETAAFMEVIATDVPGAMSMFSLTFVEAVDDAKCTKKFYPKLQTKNKVFVMNSVGVFEDT